MKMTVAKILIGLVALTMAVSPMQAGELNPVGKWQTTNGESRYEVSLCGDGTKLCAKLTWLRADARTADNLQYLNKYVVKGAKPINANKWSGIVHYAGQKIGGSVTLVNANKMRLQGCQILVCQSMEFVRL